MKKLIALLLLFPMFLFAQNKEDIGVKFIHRVTSWGDIIKQAQKEDKYIFVDCYTTWCGPCKYLTTEIFPKANVGNFYNTHFLCVGLQMDETAKDNDDIIDSRNIANSIKDLYPITAYPTFLIFNKHGVLVHKFVGAGNDTFMIKKAANALNENQQYYTLNEKYNDGIRDTLLLKNLIKASKDVGVKADIYLLQYLKSIQNLFTEENGNMLFDNVQNTGSISFDYLFSNKDVWGKILDPKKLNSCFLRLINQEIMKDNYFEFKNEKIQQEKIIEYYSKKYFDNGRKAALFFLLTYYYETKRSKNLKSLLTNFEEINSEIFANSYQMNSYAWAFFGKFTDKTLLNKALSWSKKSLEQDKDNPMYLDTYANILYKLGQTKEAIEIETKAVELVDVKDKKSYQETLDKMKKGEHTWK